MTLHGSFQLFKQFKKQGPCLLRHPPRQNRIQDGWVDWLGDEVEPARSQATGLVFRGNVRPESVAGFRGPSRPLSKIPKK